MSNTEDSFEIALARQLEMNPQTWALLQVRGVDEDTRVRLDFAFEVPDETSARQLAVFIEQDTDNDVVVDGTKKSRFARKTWSVIGTTQPTQISPTILDQWVGWMIAAGAEKGRCLFDGWAAQVPN